MRSRAVHARELDLERRLEEVRAERAEMRAANERCKARVLALELALDLSQAEVGRLTNALRTLKSATIHGLAELVRMGQPEGSQVKWRGELIDRERVVAVVVKMRQAVDAAALSKGRET